jgi:tripartite motif-containing protein 71
MRTVTSPHRQIPGVEDYPLLTFGSYGTGNGQFSNPNGIGLDAAGNVYVADTGNNRIQKFSPSGEWIVSFGTAGKGEGEFTYPRDVQVSADGNSVYVVNSGDQNGGASIKVWNLLTGNADYAFDFEWGSSGAGPGQFDYPARIAIDQEANVYVTELRNNRIQKFTAGGNLLDIWTDASSGAFGRPVEITHDGGVLYVVDKELAQIKRFAPDGQFIDQWSEQLQVPVDVAVRDNDAYVVDQAQSKVFKFTTSGEYVKSWGGPGSEDGQFSNLEGVAVDDHGYVYVIDNGNYRIQKFTADGAFVKSWGSYGTGPGQFENSKGIAIHGDALYVVDFFPGRVQQFDLDGSYVREIGGQGDTPGTFDGPYDVTVDATGYVYVADRDNHRLQKFTADGEFVALLNPETTGMPAYASPSAVAVGGDGAIYAVTDYNEGIMVFRPATVS